MILKLYDMDYFKKIKELEMKEFDTSYSEHKYLVSYNDQHFEINQILFNLIKVLQSSASVEEACTAYSQERGKEYTVEDMTNLLNNKLSTFFKEDAQPKNKTFLYKIQLVSPIVTNKFSLILKNLYRFYLYIVVFGVNISLLVYFLNNYFDLISFSLNNLDFYTFLMVVVLLFISTFFHELGHASACKYYGITPGGIGLGIYINMLVFYADVSNIWRLKRKERILVNLGGIYFQTILLIPCYFIFFHTQSYLLGYLIICTNLNFLFVLNPFLKFDGYWIMSDILGLPNLRQRSVELVKYMVERLQKKTEIRRPRLLLINPVAKYISLVYAMLSGAFMLFFFCYFIPIFIYKYAQEFPDTFNLLEANISNGIIPFDLIYYILPKTFLVILIVVYFVKFLIKFVEKVIVNIKYASSTAKQLPQ